MCKITQNLTFTVCKDRHIVLCNGRLTQIRLIVLQYRFIEQLEQCHHYDDFFVLLKQNQSNVQIAPIGVIGPKEASSSEYDFAEKLGEHLANLGLSVICGGRNGVMEAVCKGVYQQQGVSIGLIPTGHWLDANKYVKQIVTTNMGPTRNSLIALSASVLVAVGGGMGTLSEIAYGLHYDKPVFATSTAPYVDGVVVSDDLDEIITGVITVLLNLTTDV